jgi:hypothetical protein
MDCDSEFFQVNTEPVQNVRRYTFAVCQQCEEQLVGLHLPAPRRSEARRRRRARPRHTRIEARLYNERQPGRAAEGIRDDLARARRERERPGDALGPRIHQPRDHSSSFAVADAQGSKGTSSDRVFSAQKAE